MSTDRDVTRIVRSWLEEGATALPDRVLDEVLDRVPATPQRRAWWPARRLPYMNNALKMAIATAAVVVVAVAGFSLVPRDSVGGPTPTPTSSPTVISSVPLNVNMQPGRYMTDGTDEPVLPAGIQFTVPDGWHNAGWAIEKADVQVSFWAIGNTYRDPCKSVSTALVPPLGPTVGEFVSALQAQAGTKVDSTTPVTVGGHSGQLVELDWPAGVDVSKCEAGDLRLWIAPGSGDPSRGGGVGRHSTLWIVDVDGRREVIEVTSVPGSITEAKRSEARSIVESITFAAQASPAP